jgi:hypothetical protein
MLTVSGVLPAADAGAGGAAGGGGGGGGERHLSERPAGEFRRSIPLPASVDPDRISATSHLGVLTVTIAKCEQLKARKIPVRTSVLG